MKRIFLASLVLLAGFASQARAADTVYYYYNDAQGSPVAITDAHGTVVERTQYAPYGQVLNRPEHDGPGYTKHEEDAATGLTNMQQRYDDKVIGRMLSMDPMDVNPNTGASFNRYAYANDNPYRYEDPDGRCTGSHISKSDGTCASTGSYTTNVGAEPLAMAQKRVSAASGTLSQAAGRENREHASSCDESAYGLVFIDRRRSTTYGSRLFFTGRISHASISFPRRKIGASGLYLYGLSRAISGRC